MYVLYYFKDNYRLLTATISSQITYIGRWLIIWSVEFHIVSYISWFGSILFLPYLDKGVSVYNPRVVIIVIH